MAANVVDGHWIVKAGGFATVQGGIDPEEQSPALALQLRESVVALVEERIVVNSAKIELKTKGKASIVLDGDDVTIMGKSVTLVSADGAKMVVDGQMATVTGPGGAAVEGSTVALRGGSNTAPPASTSDAPQTHAVKLRFVMDEPGTGQVALANVPIRVRGYVATKSTAENKSQFRTVVSEGTTTGDGDYEVQNVTDVITMFEATLWANEVADYQHLFPENDGPLTWTIAQSDSIPGPDDALGLVIRLLNLGYDPPRSTSTPAAFRPVLIQFQRDHGLETTGENNQATQDKLRDLCGV
jgi:hypothetical protein